MSPPVSCAQSDQPAAKRFLTMQARFALKGHELVRHVRASDGRVSWVVSRAGEAWHFTHWHHVVAHLSAIR